LGSSGLYMCSVAFKNSCIRFDNICAIWVVQIPQSSTWILDVNPADRVADFCYIPGSRTSLFLLEFAAVYIWWEKHQVRSGVVKNLARIAISHSFISNNNKKNSSSSNNFYPINRLVPAPHLLQPEQSKASRSIGLVHKQQASSS
jgi:hypothetical protein